MILQFYYLFLVKAKLIIIIINKLFLSKKFKKYLILLFFLRLNYYAYLKEIIFLLKERF